MIFKSSSLVVKGLSWAHTIVQKLMRFQFNDGKDIKAMLEYLENTKDLRWHSNPRTVLQWLAKKLPAEVYAKNLKENDADYYIKLEKYVFLK